MKKLTAKEAIEKINSETIVFMGHTVKRNNYGYNVRHELQAMAERNEISPSEYYKALQITFNQMPDYQKRNEYGHLNDDLYADMSAGK